MPMNKHIVAAARLKSTTKSKNFANSLHAGTKPVIGYTMMAMIIGGISRNGTTSNTTLLA